MPVLRASLVAALLLTSSAMADSISGTASVAVGQVGVSVFGTNFFSYDSSEGSSFGQCSVPGYGNSGCFDVVSATGDYFYPNLNPQENTIQNLPSPEYPLSGAVSIPDFINFDGGAAVGGVTMDLTYVLPGGGTNCALLSNTQLAAGGTSCTVFVDGVASPYLLTNSSDGSVLYVGATMYFEAYTGVTGAAGGESAYEGVFTTELSSSILTVYDELLNQETVDSPWSATFSPTSEEPSEAPEPASLFLAGLGLLTVGYRARRKRA